MLAPADADHRDLGARACDEHLLIAGSRDGSLLGLSEGAVPAALPATNHFAFQVPTGEEVRSARGLRKAAVTETEWQDDHGFVRVQVGDPDGYRGRRPEGSGSAEALRAQVLASCPGFTPASLPGIPAALLS